MKKILLMFAACALQTLSAQVLVTEEANPANENADATASLEIRSTSKGMLVPRLTTTAIETLKTSGNATEGLVVYDDDQNCYFGYQRGVWTELTSCGTPAPVNEFNGGDFVFTGFQTFNGDDSYYPVNDTPVPGLPSNAADELSIVTLVTIPAGEEFYITDNGWFETGGFRTGEGIMKWETTAIIPARTEITFYSPQNRGAGFEWTTTHGTVEDVPDSNGSKGPQFNKNGDNVFIYTVVDNTMSLTDVSNIDDMIVGLKLKTSWDGDATSTTTSAIPSNLVDGETALSISDNDTDFNFSFNCAALSDPDGTAPFTDVEFRSVVNNQANWTPYVDDSSVLPTECNYNP